MIPEFERAKTVHSLDRAATLIGTKATTQEKQKSITAEQQIPSA
jgi:hypothetical protein